MRHILTDTELRKLDGCKVSMHFVLKGKFKGYFAIIPKPGATVLGYTWRCILTDCVTKISRNAQAKVHAGGNRSVHAWIVGVFNYLGDHSDSHTDVVLARYIPSGSYLEDCNELHYNPTKGDQGFTTSAPSIADRRVVTTAKAILFWQKRIYLLKG